MNIRNSATREPGRAEVERRHELSAAQDLPAFELIYQRYFDFVWSSSLRLGVSSAAIDDVVQEIFMVIHSKFQTLRQPASVRSWIYGIVRRTVSDHRRSQHRRAHWTGALALEMMLEQRRSLTPLDLKEQSEKVELLFSLLHEIAEPKREVFMLSELDEMSVPEIADALQIPLNTAYSRLRAARRAFEEALSRRGTQIEGRV
jgi:RNA polymerase sigma-70 factor (ECF subfamily)